MMIHATGQPRTALVTGASRGLGAAIAYALGADSMKVAINYFRDRAAAERVRSRIEQDGGCAQIFQADVREEHDVQRLVSEVTQALGAVDVLVVNATGPQPQMPIEQQTWQAFLDQLEYFVKSPLLLMQQVLAPMREQRFGRIIQIGSEVFELGNPRFANYVSAKGAQLGMTRSWALELASTGITVNLVAPGWIPGDRDAGATAEAIDGYTAGVPMKRRGTPEDVGRMVAYLASDAANFITGQKFSVNGGNTLE